MSVRAESITKTFGAARALDSVTLDVPSGSLVALVGPSGSGKTTLLRILAGLEFADPDSGPIRFDDQNVAGLSVGERRVGFVFQHYALFRNMTVFENVAFGLRARPRKSRPPEAKIRARVTELLERVQLPQYAERLPAQLSGGQRQRVALARALAIEPRVLLLDEPFGALDAQVRTELRRWLVKLHAELHVTSLFVTHDQAEALEVADRVAVMNHGRIEQVGEPEEIYYRPATEFVASFLGEANRYAGSQSGTQVAFGPWKLVGSEDAPRIAGPVRVYLRPQDVEVEHVATRSPGAVEARIVRMHAAGPAVRLELALDDGTALWVELSQRRQAALALREGATVGVFPRAWRAYPATGGGPVR
ncbi:MAG: TOBE-like domain-containing protein [Planctomycetota bacterium]|nr:TOBE-like domain-containing protein [Planctomycetota bacterium]